LAGCAASESSPPAKNPKPAQARAAQAKEQVVEETPSINLPEGYPHLVDIAELSANMQWAFEDAGTGQAVAVAPGVWGEVPPGATMEDVVNAGAFSGHCASIEAFAREYNGGQTPGGMCW